MSGIVDVIIDDREPAKFYELFKDAGAKSVRVERLPVGDFIVNQRWVIERKTIADLCISLVDGRLFKQAVNMLKSAGHPVIILEGNSRDFARCNVSREAVQGALITLSVFFNIPVLRALDSEELVRLIEYTVIQEGRFQKSAIHRYGYRPKRRKARQIFLLQGLPGIGRGRAEKLLEVFGSVEEVITADEEELAEVDGIGKTTAKRIRNILS
ncbi:MAG: helix-hairpin-helix domain-containing protein [Kiritimatiellae bacterium]|jgi:DNA excision repair protein ERCC-4|nr:helix-hairpin-helix domain-containing protein [Kiritimatiellia bacterium]